MQRKHLNTALSIALVSLLAACGGGGGGSEGASTGPVDNGGAVTPPTPPAALVPAGTTLETANYTAGSVAASVLQAVNGYRKQCGFPTASQNTLLDKIAQTHADYMQANGSLVTDYQEKGKPGFTGVSVSDRAAVGGWPSALGTGTVNAGLLSMDGLKPAEAGSLIAASWAAGAYHQILVASHSTLVGIGATATTLQGFSGYVGGVVFSSPTSTPANITTSGNVLTWPCEGVANMPYKVVSEIPKPPGTTNAFGTPVTVLGNPGDTVTISSATMVSAAGTVVNLLVLNSTNDPAKIVQLYQGVAYPASPLEPSTTYNVTINGTINGKAFTRTFRFSTGENAA
jgi:hypothetical protein